MADTDASDQMKVAAYVRVSTDEQNQDRQRQSIVESYGDGDLDWYVDLGESGSKVNREQYQELRENVEDYDLVVAHELDRLGRSFAELADFVRKLKDAGVALDFTNQPVGTDPNDDDWMQEMMLNQMIVFADAERKMIQSRVQEGVDRAVEQGKHVGRVPFGYESDEGFLVEKPVEIARARRFIEEVKKGRAKLPTARFFEIPKSKYESILDRAEENYGIEFDEDQWNLERAKVKADEKDLPPLTEDDRVIEAGSAE